jgi:tRNA nucleotidyltransferase (CCA-adding enzyme)
MSEQQCYVVGGAVRDALLGQCPKDIDYVWTGITPDYLLSQGFKQVGASFPVFLDNNGNEHALARTERKIDVGYHGFEVNFDPSITIEQDLERRDCTINSMAVKVEDWLSFMNSKNTNLVIDPYDCITCLNQRLIKHTSLAFSQDPIRVLRVARFAARYCFNVDRTTLELMEVVAHELNYVPTERIWQELSKGLMEKYPDRLFNVLDLCEAFNVNIMAPYKKFNYKSLSAMKPSDPLECRFAAIFNNFSNEDFQIMSIPNECTQMYRLYHENRADIINYNKLTPSQKINLLTKFRMFNNTDLLDKMLITLQINLPHLGKEIASFITKDVQKLKTLDVSNIVSQCSDGQEIKDRLFQERINILSNAL